MVRRCAVAGCRETDITILAHRFPKTNEIVAAWQKALDLDKYTSNELHKRFVVCCRHFSATAYRNVISNSLNTTAIPNLNENIENDRINVRNPGCYRKFSVPTRCHKLPDKLEGSLKAKSSQPPIKRLKLEAILQKALETAESPKEIKKIVPVDCSSEDETYELCEVSDIDEDEDAKSELFEFEDLPEVKIPKISEVVLTDQTTQTENIGLPTDDRLSIPEVSKDDKLIGILYPEYQNVEKIKLIEMLCEKNQKIEALEEKLKKLELAMRDLL